MEIFDAIPLDTEENSIIMSAANTGLPVAQYMDVTKSLF